MTTTYAILSTYPPTACGLASFSASLVAGLSGPDDVVDVAAVVDEDELAALGRVRRPDGPGHLWVRGRAGGALGTAAYLNAHDVAIVQHEYGIFPGMDGRDVLEVVHALTVPVVVVLHTVLQHPTLRQRAILDDLVLHASAVVTMTRAARDRLVADYGAPDHLIHVVPHGASPLVAVPAVVADTSSVPTRTVDTQPISTRPLILTWGLLGPGKGIEWAIEAMAGLRDLDPVYRIVGQTHPKVLDAQGERYRRLLERRVAELGLEDVVEFDDRYLEGDALRRLAGEASVVVLPYDSPDQVTSGVLVEAVSAGLPVVATAFPHARELLASGAGVVVDRRSPDAIGLALRRILTQPDVAARMVREATRIAPDLQWSAVGLRYRQIARAAVDQAAEALSA